MILKLSLSHHLFVSSIVEQKSDSCKKCKVFSLCLCCSLSRHYCQILKLFIHLLFSWSGS